jgi:hypothetical protein
MLRNKERAVRMVCLCSMMSQGVEVEFCYLLNTFLLICVRWMMLVVTETSTCGLSVCPGSKDGCPERAFQVEVKQGVTSASYSTESSC